MNSKYTFPITKEGGAYKIAHGLCNNFLQTNLYNIARDETGKLVISIFSANGDTLYKSSLMEGIKADDGIKIGNVLIRKGNIVGDLKGEIDGLDEGTIIGLYNVDVGSISDVYAVGVICVVENKGEVTGVLAPLQLNNDLPDNMKYLTVYKESDEKYIGCLSNQEGECITIRDKNGKEHEYLFDVTPERPSSDEILKVAKQANTKIDELVNQLEQQSIDPTEKHCRQFKIVKGEEHGKINDAKIEDGNGNQIAQFSNIGYYFHDGELHIRNHTTDTSMEIPGVFHFLRVVQDDEGKCKFALCNELGNLLYEHKKYDPKYIDLPKFVEKEHIKMDVDTFMKYHHCHTWRPLFHLSNDPVTEGVHVHEVNEGIKVGKLIDEFIYFKDDEIHYKNYHKEQEECCYREDLKVGYDNSLSIQHTDGSEIKLEHSFDLL